MLSKASVTSQFIDQFTSVSLLDIDSKCSLPVNSPRYSLLRRLLLAAAYVGHLLGNPVALGNKTKDVE
jgi:hypothetical protein